MRSRWGFFVYHSQSPGDCHPWGWKAGSGGFPTVPTTPLSRPCCDPSPISVVPSENSALPPSFHKHKSPLRREEAFLESSAPYFSELSLNCFGTWGQLSNLKAVPSVGHGPAEAWFHPHPGPVPGLSLPISLPALILPLQDEVRELRL